MKYLVYTDGATDEKRGKVASSFFIRTEDTFIGMKSYVFDNKNNSHTELFAVGSAAEFLMDNVKITPEDEVVVFSDSQRAIDLIRKLMPNPYNTGYADVKLRISMNAIKTLDSECNLEIIKTKAHREGWNGNKVADRMAKFSLKRAVGR